MPGMPDGPSAAQDKECVLQEVRATESFHGTPRYSCVCMHSCMGSQPIAEYARILLAF